MIYVSIITIIYANIIMIYAKYDHHNEISPTIFTYKEVLTRSIPPKVTRRTLVIKKSVSSQEKSIRKNHPFSMMEKSIRNPLPKTCHGACHNTSHPIIFPMIQ